MDSLSIDRLKTRDDRGSSAIGLSDVYGVQQK